MRLARLPGPSWFLLAALVCFSTGLRFWGGSRVPIPWITPDEVIYGELGRSLYHTGEFRLLGRPAEFISLVYPALAGVPLVATSLARGYHALKLVQALVMSLTAVPVYVWARSLGARGWAFAAATLTVAIPGLAYSGLIMTEVAFYPLVLLAAFALAALLEQPTRTRTALFVLACAAAAMTRLQAFVLLPVLLTASALEVVLGRPRRQLLRLAPAAVTLAVLGLAWTGWRLRHGGPLSRVFGAYEPAGQIHYSTGRAVRFVLYHYADLALFTGLVPLCAVLLLLGARDRGDAPLRAYLSTTLALCLWFPLEVGVFASEHVGYLAERNLLPLAPVLFVGFAAWLARGGPRPLLPLAAAIAGSLVLLLVLPVNRVVRPEAFPDSFTLLPLIRLEKHSPGTDLDLLVLGIAAAALAVFALLPRRFLLILPLALVGVFAALSVETTNRIAFEARVLERQSGPPDQRWIDSQAQGPAVYLYIGESNWPGVWESVFWNDRIQRVYDLLTARIPGGLPQDSVGPLPDGRLVLVDGSPARADYVVSQYPVAFRGHAIASGGDGLILWRLDQPVRLSVWTQRVAGHIRVLAYASRPSRLRVELAGPPGSGVDLRRNDRRYRTFKLPESGRWRSSIPGLPPKPFGTGLCTFDVYTDPATTAPTVTLVPESG